MPGRERGRNEEWQLPKDTMRECLAKESRDAGFWESNSSEYRARLLGIPFKSSLAQTSSVLSGAQSMLVFGLRCFNPLATDFLLRLTILGFVQDRRVSFAGQE